MELDGDDFTVRPVGADSMAALLALYRQCEDFLALGPNPYASVEMIQRDLVTTAGEGGHYCGIYQRGTGELAGVLDVVPGGHQGDPRLAYLELLMLGKPYRGQGLGERVFAALLVALRQRGVEALEAGVQENNPDAQRFWLRMGFTLTGPATPQADGTVAAPMRIQL